MKTYVTTKVSKTPECEQSVTIHDNGVQVHSVILLNVYGAPISAAAIIMRENGVIEEPTFVSTYISYKK